MTPQHTFESFIFISFDIMCSFSLGVCIQVCVSFFFDLCVCVKIKVFVFLECIWDT